MNSLEIVKTIIEALDMASIEYAARSIRIRSPNCITSLSLRIVKTTRKAYALVPFGQYVH